MPFSFLSVEAMTLTLPQELQLRGYEFTMSKMTREDLERLTKEIIRQHMVRGNILSSVLKTKVTGE